MSELDKSTFILALDLDRFQNFIQMYKGQGSQTHCGLFSRINAVVDMTSMSDFFVGFGGAAARSLC